jgi:hypothetical protein
MIKTGTRKIFLISRIAWKVWRHNLEKEINPPTPFEGGESYPTYTRRILTFAFASAFALMFWCPPEIRRHKTHNFSYFWPTALLTNLKENHYEFSS